MPTARIPADGAHRRLRPDPRVRARRRRADRRADRQGRLGRLALPAELRLAVGVRADPGRRARRLVPARAGRRRSRPSGATWTSSNVLETTFATAEGRVRVTDAMTLTRQQAHLADARAGAQGRGTRRDGSAAVGLRAALRLRPGGDAHRAPRGPLVRARPAPTRSCSGSAARARRAAQRCGHRRARAGAGRERRLLALRRRPRAGRDPRPRGLGAAARAHQALLAGVGRPPALRGRLAARPSPAAPSRSSCSPSRRRARSSPRRRPRSRSGSAARRNWDYRFTWLRDASWTLDALLRLGYHDEAHAFFWWLMHASRLTQPRLQVLYRLDGSEHARERELPELSGYRGSQPVRIGNGARDQVQLDVYGAVLEAIWLYARASAGSTATPARRSRASPTTSTKHWRDKDNGIWEVRDERDALHPVEGALLGRARPRVRPGRERPDPESQRPLARGGRRAEGLGGRARLGRRAAEPRARAGPARARRQPAHPGRARVRRASGSTPRSPRSSGICARARTSTATAATTGSRATRARSWPARSGSSTRTRDRPARRRQRADGRARRARQRRRALLGGDRPARPASSSATSRRA